jgi:hypothetical protein
VLPRSGRFFLIEAISDVLCVIFRRVDPGKTAITARRRY